MACAHAVSVIAFAFRGQGAPEGGAHKFFTIAGYTLNRRRSPCRGRCEQANRADRLSDRRSSSRRWSPAPRNPSHEWWVVARSALLAQADDVRFVVRTHADHDRLGNLLRAIARTNADHRAAPSPRHAFSRPRRSEEHTSELQSL